MAGAKQWIEYGSGLRHRVPYLVTGVALLVLLFAPLLLLALGHTPRDDALRHVAKVLSGRDWSEILVLREGIYDGYDSHPGWHTILATVHNQFGWQRDGLLIFSVTFLWSAALLPGLLFRRRAEAFLFILTTITVMAPEQVARWFFGRPFLFSFGVVLFALLNWDALRRHAHRPAIWALVASLAALQVWIHGNWYLIGLPLGAFGFSALLSGDFRGFLRIAAAVVAGVIVGACLTGHPWDFITYYAKHAYWAIAESGGGGPKASELSGGEPFAGLVLPVLGLFSLRFLSSRWPGIPLIHPAPVLVLLCGILGMFVSRFWSDWGVVALIAWATLELEAFLLTAGVRKPRTASRPAEPEDFSRLFAALACGALFVLAAVLPQHKTGESVATETATLQAAYAEYPHWFPGPGGTVYGDHMSIFYSVFFALPEPPWRYMVGYEPGMMPPADRKIYDMSRRLRAMRPLQPWARQMTPHDRMILSKPASIDPAKALPGLDWHFVPPRFWFGIPAPASMLPPVPRPDAADR